MSSQQICEPSAMTEAGAIRGVYPASAMKRLARLMDVPIDTARHWLYRNFNPAQRQQLARALLVEMDRQDVERTALRRRLAEWAAEE